MAVIVLTSSESASICSKHRFPGGSGIFQLPSIIYSIQSHSLNVSEKTPGVVEKDSVYNLALIHHYHFYYFGLKITTKGPRKV